MRGAPRIGNRALGRLLAGDHGGLAVQRQLLPGAGNLALQRVPDEDEVQPAHGGQQQPQQERDEQEPAGDQPASPYLTDNPVFHRGTQALDLISGVGGARGGADFVGVSDGLFGTHLGDEAARAIAPEFLPGVGMLVNGVGMVESGVRAGDARDRSRVMGRASNSAEGERAQQLLQLGAQEQTREQTRHTTRAGAGGIQTALMAGGLVAGVSTGGTVPLMAATAIGGAKVAETVYNLARRYFGKEASQRHAQQLLFAAQNGDASVVSALTQMGIPATSLEDSKVWQTAVERLGALMPQGEVEYEDDGAARSGPAVPIEERRALQPRLPGHQPYGSISSEDPEHPNPLVGMPPQAQDHDDHADDDVLAALDPGRQTGTAMQPPPAFASALDLSGGSASNSGRSTPLPGQTRGFPPHLRPSAAAAGHEDDQLLTGVGRRLATARPMQMPSAFGFDSDEESGDLAHAVYMQDADDDRRPDLTGMPL